MRLIMHDLSPIIRPLRIERVRPGRMGYFITFEGIEGCGKTTQIQRAAQSLKEAGHRVVVTREPGGCPIADDIRAILLDAGNSAMVPMTELLLYAAARAQHVAEVIAPALAEGAVVLCDRFTDSTLVYQGFGRNLDRDLIARLNTLAAGQIRPDLTILLDCPVTVGLARAAARISSRQTNREERFEQESLLFHERVREGFLALACGEPHRFAVIDGNEGVEATATAVAGVLLNRVPRR